MIKIYSNKSDKKLRQCIGWLTKYGIEYDLLNFNENDFTYEEYLKVLALTDTGVFDLVAKRSKDYEIIKSKVDINSMTLKEFYSFILEHPEIVNQPIMVDESKLAIGYKLDDITVFLPRSKRGITMIDEEYAKIMNKKD